MVKLKEQGWNPHAKKRLERIVAEGAGRNLVAVFDFDNTLICRDIGEATFAVLVRDGLISKAGIPKDITPSFSLKKDRQAIVSLDSVSDPIEYYELFLQSTVDSPDDSAPYVNAYAWLVSIMSGLKPGQVVEATNKAYGTGKAERDLKSISGLTRIELAEGEASYYVPFFYPEMVELAGLFIQNGYDVWVVSASNVWTVRWMVTRVLNEKLKERGFGGIPADHVIGVSTLLLDDRDMSLHKDMSLVRENRKYAAMEESELLNYTLTANVVYPMSSYYGKVANILQYIGRQPYFVAGDSPNDHAMLSLAKHKLWLARLEKPEYQRKTASLIKGNDNKAWVVQPVLYKQSPGFVRDRAELENRLGDKALAVNPSLEILTEVGLIKDF